MPSIKIEETKVLKAQIYDLSEKGAKQALMAMVEVLKDHPSILSNVFCILVEDATNLTNWNKEVASKPELRSLFERG